MLFNDLQSQLERALVENDRLREENRRLREQLGLPNIVVESPQATTLEVAQSPDAITNLSPAVAKIALFRDLFRGREDVFAMRWEGRSGKSGYSPACLHEWDRKLCAKPRVKCAECENREFRTVTDEVINDHLSGRYTVGIYPLLSDETCWFLAVDFDKAAWRDDVKAFILACKEVKIPAAIERSRSGGGAHVWIFFDRPISASLARKLGCALLTRTMEKRHQLGLDSYDRLFPNQDTMPKGGFGNLIALPLQFEAKRNGNSLFLNANFEPHTDQWSFLSSIKRLKTDDIGRIIKGLVADGNVIGVRTSFSEEDEDKPWTLPPSGVRQLKLIEGRLPDSVRLVLSNMIYVEKRGLPPVMLNRLIRLAAFQNPEFYKAQAMRLPTFGKPRVISCAEDFDNYIGLPRGCLSEALQTLAAHSIRTELTDKRFAGNRIDVDFYGGLAPLQQEAVNAVLDHDIGVISAETAFGKTVLGVWLIAERKVNTLVLVHRRQLMDQWRERLGTFLNRSPKEIGIIGGGKARPTGVIDIGIIQSLNSKGQVKDLVADYGQIIVDECHHISAFSFEQVLRQAKARYVVGLTATPVRKDGHQPIIFMQCGPIRFQVKAKEQALRRPFEHYVIPRFTGFKAPVVDGEKELTIQELYAQIAIDEIRNQLIVDDVINAQESGRNSLVLTERTAHVELLAKKLSGKIPNVIALTGSMGVKETKKILAKISETPPDKQLTLVATGKYIGEGFDEPRLDTLFLAMPISWKGTLQQYAGRLHRLYKNKNEVQIYDYVDIHVRMLERMYNKRLKGYASIGYRAKGESNAPGLINIIFDEHSFLSVFRNDIVHAQREVLIVSPFVAKRRVTQMLQYFSAMVGIKVKITVITRPAEDFREKGRPALEQIFGILKNAGINMLFKSNIHQKFAIIDQRVVWYGSVNLLSFGRAKESIMRLESPSIANELMKSIEWISE
ncbi:MAG: DEAD/DEAH box helicase family protein [Actinobacteria bacterium]|nr:DEAD/DEAH box helicase family protein [Actinomycetota bacterium]